VLCIDWGSDKRHLVSSSQVSGLFWISISGQMLVTGFRFIMNLHFRSTACPRFPVYYESPFPVKCFSQNGREM
jgi:hypothetical protein